MRRPAGLASVPRRSPDGFVGGAPFWRGVPRGWDVRGPVEAACAVGASWALFQQIHPAVAALMTSRTFRRFRRQYAARGDLRPGRNGRPRGSGAQLGPISLLVVKLQLMRRPSTTLSPRARRGPAARARAPPPSPTARPPRVQPWRMALPVAICNQSVQFGAHPSKLLRSCLASFVITFQSFFWSQACNK